MMMVSVAVITVDNSEGTNVLQGMCMLAQI
jgi:hypothetical protein